MAHIPTHTEVVDAALVVLVGSIVRIEYVFQHVHLEALATPGTDTCTREMPIAGQVYRHAAWLAKTSDENLNQFSFGAGKFIANHVDSLHIERSEDVILPTIRLSRFWLSQVIKDPDAVRALLNF